MSATAGLPLSRLAELVAPVDQVARAVPMPAVATRSSRTPVHPPLAPVLEVFERLGGTMPIDDGDEFEAIFTAMGTVAPFFEYLRILSDFLVGHGLPAPDARQVVAATYTGLLEQLDRPRESGLRGAGQGACAPRRRQRAAHRPDA